MNYIYEIFQRANIQQIREFLLHGGENNVKDVRSYQERLDISKKNIINMINNTFKNKEERDFMTDFIFGHISTFQDVYMEIGLQAGVLLSVQTFQNGATITDQSLLKN